MPTVATHGPRRLWLPVGLGVVLLAVAVVAAVMLLLDRDSTIPGIVRDPPTSVDGLLFVESTENEDTLGSDHATATLHAPEGGLTLLYFGFLSCPDVCPMTMADIQAARRDLAPADDDRIEVAFVTLDPERDDGDSVLNYLGHFFDHGYRALRAADDGDLRAAADGLGVTYEIEAHEPGDDDYGVTHSAITSLVDDQGTVVRELPFGTTSDEFVAAIEASLRVASAAGP